MVYRGGLENRFGSTPDGGSNPSLSARLCPARSGVQAGKICEWVFMSNWTTILFWTVAVGIVFGYLWWQGQIKRLAAYVQETREELKKCSWPTWDELKGSTVVIVITIVLLGGFTVVVDLVFNYIFFKL